MPVSLKILVGTMTGTAELVAEEISDVLVEAGHEVEVEPMDDLGVDVFAGGGTFLICTSTYGQGDVPDNAMPFYEALKADKPDLSGVRYGVYSLGDKTYSDTFNFGGKKFDAILCELGAKRLGALAMHDAGAGTVPEEEGAEWALEWVAGIEGVKA
ncbi:MAG: flavodoxin domain-containing protein [Alphaproteobacteria bacterium]